MRNQTQKAKVVAISKNRVNEFIAALIMTGFSVLLMAILIQYQAN
jgi:dihydroxyacetone kinase